jgi:hypothetical protein
MAKPTDDDDILTGAVPAPEAEATASERAHARTFADLVDKTLTGRTPPAMSSDDRALLVVATVIRATSGTVELSSSKRRSIVEDALRQAVGGTTASTSGAVVPIARARSRRWAPWAIAGGSMLVAAAAVLLFWLRAPERVTPETAQAAPIPAEWTSRPADPLIGPIARQNAGDAGTRIDTIFADRLGGYRERTLARRKP